MKLSRPWLVVSMFLFLCLLSGCGGGGGGSETAVSSDPGNMTLAINLAALGQSPTTLALAQATGDIVIDSVAMNVTRDGYQPISQELTISNNLATGRVENLDPGYWNVEVLVYSASVLIYQGQSDVNIIAGAEVECQILFDPVTPEPTTGSLAITVGMNPMPGYQVLNQTVSELLFDGVDTFYILDSSAALIAVYDATTFTRIEDIQLSSAPQSVALDPVSGTIFLGYPSGQVYSLSVDTKEMALLGEALAEVWDILVVNSDFLLLGTPGTYDMDLKAMDRSTGQIVSTMSSWYDMTSFVINPDNAMVYAHHIGVSPTDLHYFTMDATTGELLSNGDSPYHGDYYMGYPLRLIRNNTRLATSSGNLFTSSEVRSEDLKYAGSLGQSYIDIVSDDAAGKLYMLNKTGIYKLLVLNMDSFFVELAIDLGGTPKRVFSTPDRIVVFTELDGKWYERSFAKLDLGF